jgi:hypothetical protein
VGAWDSVNCNWSYAYDPLNRLASASKTGQSYTYGYDRTPFPHSARVFLVSGGLLTAFCGRLLIPSGFADQPLSFRLLLA